MYSDPFLEDSDFDGRSDNWETKLGETDPMAKDFMPNSCYVISQVYEDNYEAKADRELLLRQAGKVARLLSCTLVYDPVTGKPIWENFFGGWMEEEYIRRIFAQYFSQYPVDQLAEQDKKEFLEQAYDYLYGMFLQLYQVSQFTAGIKDDADAAKNLSKEVKDMISARKKLKAKDAGTDTQALQKAIQELLEEIRKLDKDGRMGKKLHKLEWLDQWRIRLNKFAAKAGKKIGKTLKPYADNWKVLKEFDDNYGGMIIDGVFAASDSMIEIHQVCNSFDLLHQHMDMLQYVSQNGRTRAVRNAASQLLWMLQDNETAMLKTYALGHIGVAKAVLPDIIEAAVAENPVTGALLLLRDSLDVSYGVSTNLQEKYELMGYADLVRAYRSRFETCLETAAVERGDGYMSLVLKSNEEDNWDFWSTATNLAQVQLLGFYKYYQYRRWDGILEFRNEQKDDISGHTQVCHAEMMNAASQLLFSANQMGIQIHPDIRPLFVATTDP